MRRRFIRFADDPVPWRPEDVDEDLATQVLSLLTDEGQRGRDLALLCPAREDEVETVLFQLERFGRGVVLVYDFDISENVWRRRGRNEL